MGELFQDRGGGAGVRRPVALPERIATTGEGDDEVFVGGGVFGKPLGEADDRSRGEEAPEVDERAVFVVVGYEDLSILFVFGGEEGETGEGVDC